MSLGAYLAGFLVWAAVLGSAALGAWLVLQGRLAGLRGAARWVAFLLLATAAVLLSYLVPGILGILARGTVVIAAILVAAVAWIAAGRPRPRPPRLPATVAMPALPASWGAIAATLSVAMLAVVVLAALIERAPAPVTNLDALNFHLPGIAAWIQSGGFWQVNQYIPNLAHGNYPQNGDVLLMSSILPWHDDAFVRLVSVPLLAWAALSVYAIGVELGAARPRAILAAALFVSLPAVLHPATLELLTDPLMLAAMGSGLLFLLRHWRTGERADLLLAGLGLGIAFGTKWYGISTAVAVLALWGASWLLCRRGLRPLLRAAAPLLAMIAAAGGFWLLRNLVESGNPLFPVRVAPLGISIFNAPYDRIRALSGFTIAHYLSQPHIISTYIVPAIWKGIALGGLVFAAGVVATAAVGVGRRPRDPRLLFLAAAAGALAVVYVVTPYTALGGRNHPIGAAYNVRYLMPALLVAAPLTACLIGRWARLAPALIALVLLGQVDALRRTAEQIGTRPLLEALAVVAALAAIVLLVQRRRRSLTLGPIAAAGAAALAIAALVLAGQELQTRFNEGRYQRVDAVLDRVLADAPSGHRIGIVGDWGVTRLSPIWPLFGPRLGNDVHYVGTFRDGMLRDYRTRSSFLAGLRRQRDEEIVVARGEPPRPEIKQDRWLRAAGYRQLARGDRLTLYAAPRGTAP